MEIATLSFGEWLRSELDRRGMEQADLHRATGVSTGLISEWISNVKTPRSPSCRKIAAALGLPDELVLFHAGHLDRLPEPARRYEVVRQLQEDNRRLRTDIEELQNQLVVSPAGVLVPVVGRIPADEIRWVADGDADPVEVVEGDLRGARKPQGLLITGDCMTSIGILPGDVVIVDRHVDREPQQDEIVVIRYQGEHTLKRYRKVGNRIELRDGARRMVCTISALDDFSIEGFYVTFKPLAPR